MDTDWCLTCGRQTNDEVEAYCSKTCETLDRRSVVYSLPTHVLSHWPSFHLPKEPVLHRMAHTKSHTRRETRARTSDGLSKGTPHNTARFRDEELIESRSGNFGAPRWPGKDREGILVWARAVLPGLDEDCVSLVTETSSTISDLDRFLTRLPPFPLTAQNLAPPCVTIAPRHALLNHTSTHYPSNPEDRTAPSLSQDDASLLTPATDSVITPSGPYKPAIAPAPSSKQSPHLTSLINKVCTWIASPSRVPRASSEGNPCPPPTDGCVAVPSDETASCCYISPYGDKSSAEAVLSLTSPTDTRFQVTAFGGEPYEYDAAYR